MIQAMTHTCWHGAAIKHDSTDDAAMLPIIYPLAITRVPWLAWQHGQEAKIGLRTVMLCSGGLGTQARQIMLRKPGEISRPHTHAHACGM